MADDAAGPGDTEERSLPFLEEAQPASATATEDPRETTPDAEQPQETEGENPEAGDPQAESDDEGQAGRGEQYVDEESDFDIEVLDVETDPVSEIAAVPSPAHSSVVDAQGAMSEAGSSSSDAETSEEEDDDTAELEALAVAPSTLDDFSHDDYVAATTVEYLGLAEEMEAADREDTQLQAVAVTMPGLESGVVGFEDVTGESATVEDDRTTEGGRSDLGLRVVTALILMGMLVGALWAGGGWFVAFVTLIGILALGEFYATVRTAGYQPVALIGFLTLIAMMVAGFRYGPFGIVGWFTVGVVGVLLWYAVLVRRDPLPNASITVLGFAWVGMLLSFIGPLAATASFRPLVLAIVLTVAGLDVGSYFVGRRFGRHKMSPVLSPNKTYEGLLGGVILAGGVAVTLTYIDWFAPLDLRGALFLTGVAVTLGPFGDLAVSMLKRQIGVKDMGSILPGHGGLLDRIDALILIIPVSYFVFSWLGYFAP